MSTRQNKWLLFLFAITWIILMPSQAFSGDCLDSRENYLKAISKVDPKEDIKYRQWQGGVEEQISCLWSDVVYIVMGYEYFASPTAIKKIQKQNEHTKDLAYEVLPKFLESPSPSIRCDAAKALAYYGWSESFEYLMNCNGGATNKAILFAILGDKRAIPWIIEQFKRIDKKYRSRPIFSYPSKMTYLNALYHLASPESLPFINKVIENPKPEKIKSRAKKVQGRIYELFPESKNNALQK